MCSDPQINLRPPATTWERLKQPLRTALPFGVECTIIGLGWLLWALSRAVNVPLTSPLASNTSIEPLHSTGSTPPTPIEQVETAWNTATALQPVLELSRLTLQPNGHGHLAGRLTTDEAFAHPTFLDSAELLFRASPRWRIRSVHSEGAAERVQFEAEL